MECGTRRVLALAALFSPITLTAGPIVAYNVAVLLGPVVSGLALALALGVWIERWWPRAVAGFLYGFSPFMIAHSFAGHVNLLWAVLPPVLLWVVHTLTVAPDPRPWRTGAVAGLAFALQTLLYTQTVALCAVMLVVVALVLAVRFPRAALRRVPVVLRGAAACLATYAVLAAYPLYVLLAGPGRPRTQIRDPEATNSDAANLLVPTRLTKLQMRMDPLAEQLHTHIGEQGGYVGVALLLVIAAAVLTARRPVDPHRRRRGARRVGAVARGEPRDPRPRHRPGAALAPDRRRAADRGDRDNAVPGGGGALCRGDRRAVVRSARQRTARCAPHRGAGRDRSRGADLAALERAGRHAR